MNLSYSVRTVCVSHKKEAAIEAAIGRLLGDCRAATGRLSYAAYLLGGTLKFSCFKKQNAWFHEFSNLNRNCLSVRQKWRSYALFFPIPLGVLFKPMKDIVNGFQGRKRAIFLHHPRGDVSPLGALFSHADDPALGEGTQTGKRRLDRHCGKSACSKWQSGRNT